MRHGRGREAWLVVSVAIGVFVPDTAAVAQSSQVPTIELPHYDVTVLGGWGAVREVDERSYASWDGVGVVALEIGRYWTDHVKSELQVQFTSEARSYGGYPERSIDPGATIPIFRYSERFTRVASVAMTAQYQFFRNQWFHPFLGAGVSLDRDRVRLVWPEQTVPVGSNGPYRTLPREELPARIDATWRPIIMGGFKVYVAQRAFLRSDAGLALRQAGRSTFRWQFGAGFDF